MIGLYALKPWYTRRLTPILNTAVTHNVSPDALTAAGVVAAAAAGAFVALGWWPLAALFLALRLAGMPAQQDLRDIDNGKRLSSHRFPPIR